MPRLLLPHALGWEQENVPFALMVPLLVKVLNEFRYGAP
jgi:hypothetical protein